MPKLVTYNQALRDARPLTLYTSIHKRELAALRKAKDPVLRSMAERIDAEVHDEEQRLIDRLHGSLRQQGAIRRYEAQRRAALTPEQRAKEDRERDWMQRAVGAMLGD